DAAEASVGGDERLRAISRGDDPTVTDAVAAERRRDPAVAIHVVRAVPVLPAARVLIDLEVGDTGRDRSSRCDRPHGARPRPTTHRTVEREIADVDRARIAEIRDVAPVACGPGIAQRESDTHDRAPGEERQRLLELASEECSLDADGRTHRAPCLDGGPRDARLAGPAVSRLEP